MAADLTAPQRRMMDEVERGDVEWHPRRGAGEVRGSTQHPNVLTALETRRLVRYEWGHVDDKGREYAIMRPALKESPSAERAAEAEANDPDVTAHRGEDR